MSFPPCPECQTPLTGEPTCSACGIRLIGPDAERLWQVDVELGHVDARRGVLLAERGRLLALLHDVDRATTVRATSSAGTSVTPGPAWDAWDPNGKSGVPQVRTAQPASAPRTVREWTPQRVQNTLLGLGGLLLTVAGIVFAAVTYDRLGAGGRAAVLVALTLVAGLVVPRLIARGLGATAETVAAVALVLAALDAYGLRTLGLAEDSRGLVYAAGSCLGLALLCAAYATVVPVRLPRVGGVVLAHLPVPLLLSAEAAGLGTAGLVLAVLACVDLVAWTLMTRTPDGQVRRDLLAALLPCASLSVAMALGLAAAGAFLPDGRTAGALGLLVLAALAGATGLRTAGSTRFTLHAVPAPLAALAALALSADSTTSVRQPLVLAAVGLIAMQLSALLPYAWRPGPVAGALATAAFGLITQAEAVAQALVLPLAWLADPWTLTAGSSARAALSPDQSWSGTAVTLVVLLAAAVAAAGAGLALHRVRVSLVPVAALAVLSTLVLPLGLNTSYPLALVLLLATTIGLLTGAAVLARTDLSWALLGAGSATGLLTGVWAAADRSATLLVLPVLALAFAAVALRHPIAVSAAGITAGAALASVGAARDLSGDQVGGLLLLAPAALIALTFALDRSRRLAAEVAAALLGLTSMALAITDTGWLSWTLALIGLLALADALHPDRRRVAAAGALLLAASSWVRLADAGVESPEPYVVPLGFVALGFGYLRARRDASVRSFAAYGPGLSALLLPSLIASLDDETLTRPLLLGAVALGVLLVGARERLQAPLVLGAAVLVIDALHLLAPYAAALPRWTTLGASGLLLVAVGATYERRRQDLVRARDRFEQLT